MSNLVGLLRVNVCPGSLFFSWSIWTQTGFEGHRRSTNENLYFLQTDVDKILQQCTLRIDGEIQ